MSKPPLGIIPRRLWLENRLDELSAAIVRYCDAEINPPWEWIVEYNEILDELTVPENQSTNQFSLN